MSTKSLNVMVASVATEIISKAEAYIKRLFADSLPPDLVYHNFDHTSQVAHAARQIGQAEGLSEVELEIVTLAAWFHDSGHIKRYQGHETESAWIAQRFLRDEGFPVWYVNQVVRCILATQYPQQPQSKLHRVLCDADLHHLSTPDHHAQSELLRTEWESRGRVYSDTEWREVNQEFVSGHRYWTRYGEQVLEGRKRALFERAGRNEIGLQA